MRWLKIQKSQLKKTHGKVPNTIPTFHSAYFTEEPLHSNWHSITQWKWITSSQLCLAPRLCFEGVSRGFCSLIIPEQANTRICIFLLLSCVTKHNPAQKVPSMPLQLDLEFRGANLKICHRTQVWWGIIRNLHWFISCLRTNLRHFIGYKRSHGRKGHVTVFSQWNVLNLFWNIK